MVNTPRPTDYLLNETTGVFRSGVTGGITAQHLRDGFETAFVRSAASVRQYGAVGDGTNNDATAIQAALNANKAVYFPPGTYRVNSTIFVRTSGTRIFGDGPGIATIQSASNIDILTVAAADSSQLSDVHVHGLSFERTGTATSGAGLRLTNTRAAAVRDCSVRAAFFGLDAATAAGLTVSGCTFRGTVQRGLRITSGSDVTLVGNVYDGCDTANSGGMLDLDAVSATVVGSTFAGTGAQNGLRCGSTARLAIDGNSFRNLVNDIVWPSIDDSNKANNTGRVGPSNISDDSTTLTAGTTLTLPTVGETFSVTAASPVTVTTVSQPGFAGRRVVLTFANGNVTLSSSTAFQLATTSWTPVAGNTLTLMSTDRGSWIEVARSTSGSTGVAAPAFYVATTGSDANDGSLNAPFLTLTKARDSMRASTTVKRTVVRAGTYRMPVEMTLTNQDNNTTYEAYAGETVQLTNAVLHPMTLASGTLWRSTTAPDNEYVWMVLLNGSQQIINRWPVFNGADVIRGGWLYSDNAGAANQYVVKTGDRASLPACVTTPSGERRRIVGFSGTYGYNTSLYTGYSNGVASCNFTQQQVTAGNRFYFEAVGTTGADLTQEGAWTHDRNGTNQVHYRAASGWNGSGLELVRTQGHWNQCVIKIQGADASTRATGITIRGFEFYGCATYEGSMTDMSAAVRMEHADNCLVEACRFRDLDQGVIVLAGQNCKVRGNLFEAYRKTACAVVNGHSGYDIRGNLFRDGPTYFRAWESLYLGGSAGAGTAAYNTLLNVWGHGLGLYASSAVVEYNYFNNTARTTSDTGAVYGFQPVGQSYGMNCIVRRNFFEPDQGLHTTASTTGPGNYGTEPWVWSVYPDERCGGWQVSENVFRGTALGCFIGHLPTALHSLTNNLFYQNEQTNHLINNATHDNGRLAMNRNIFWWGTVAGGQQIIIRDGTSSYTEDGSVYYTGGPDAGNLFPEGNKATHRAQSYVTNTTDQWVTFADAANGDYTVTAGAPVNWVQLPTKAQTGTTAYSGTKWAGL